MLGYFTSCMLEIFTPEHLGPVRQVRRRDDG
jgi:hypothetical protein